MHQKPELVPNPTRGSRRCSCGLALARIVHTSLVHARAVLGGANAIRLREACRISGLALLAALGLTACTSLSSRSIPYVGAPRPDPSAAAAIAILHAEPTRPFDKLGEVVIESSLSPAPPIDKIEARLRNEGAKLGAEALVLVHDQTQPVGAVAMGPWWSPSISPIQGRLIVAIAIKYK
jgi:hypothetical protein